MSVQTQTQKTQTQKTQKTQTQKTKKYSPKHPLMTLPTASMTSGGSASFLQLTSNNKLFTAAEATHSIKDRWLQKAIEEVTQEKMSGLIGTNLLLLTDSYKVSHREQYPFGKTMDPTGIVYSYFESRGAGTGGHKEIVFFGLQYFIKRYLEGVVVTQEKIDEAAEYYAGHFGSNTVFGKEAKEAWKYIITQHGGKLPVKIMAVPEGTVLPVKNVLFTLENTDPACYWLTNFLETLLVQVWYPMTVASNSRAQKKVILSALQKSGSPLTHDDDGNPIYDIDFKLHDFGCRGVSSMETAGLGAMAHLTQFNGTDTVPGLVFAKEYYGATPGETKDDAPGYVKAGWGMTIPASEHSTMTSWGDKPSDEFAAYNNMLTVYPKGPVACVIDAYNMYLAAEFVIGEALTKSLEDRKDVNDFVKKKFVIRPDSGTPMFSDDKLLEALWKKFKAVPVGETNTDAEMKTAETKTGYNEKEFRVLRDDIRIIQGDGIDYQAIIDILGYLMEEGEDGSRKWSADNIAFGSGGGLLQKLNRDTQKCAFKASYIYEHDSKREHTEHDSKREHTVYKKPIDAPFKKSKQGRLTLTKTLTKDGTVWKTNTERTDYQMENDNNILVCVFENGLITKDYNLQDIVSRSSISNGSIEIWDDMYQNYDTTKHSIVTDRIKDKAEAIMTKNSGGKQNEDKFAEIFAKNSSGEYNNSSEEHNNEMENFIQTLQNELQATNEKSKEEQLNKAKNTQAMVLRLKEDVIKYKGDQELYKEINKARLAVRIAQQQLIGEISKIDAVHIAREANWSPNRYNAELDNASTTILDNIIQGIF